MSAGSTCAAGHVHFVGSVPLADANAVIGTLGRNFGTLLRRIPDGETGERTNWLQFQEGVFERMPELEKVEGDFDWRNPTAKKAANAQFRLRSGATITASSFGALGFAALHDALAFATLGLAGLLVKEVLLDVLDQTFLLTALLEAADGLLEGFTVTGFDANHAASL